MLNLYEVIMVENYSDGGPEDGMCEPNWWTAKVPAGSEDEAMDRALESYSEMDVSVVEVEQIG